MERNGNGFFDYPVEAGSTDGWVQTNNHPILRSASLFSTSGLIAHARSTKYALPHAERQEESGERESVNIPREYMSNDGQIMARQGLLRLNILVLVWRVP